METVLGNLAFYGGKCTGMFRGQANLSFGMREFADKLLVNTNVSINDLAREGETAQGFNETDRKQKDFALKLPENPSDMDDFLFSV